METLAVKYRPQTFEDVVEQDNIKKILMNQLNNGIRNAYLFCGPAGCGKTTNGRLFAKAINNGDTSNLVELDAASHSGVEDVRKLIADSKFKPVGCRYRVFIIDECHSLSNTAWQSFLKCLEEPTPTSVFIFCTTDPQKIPKTIISRVQQFDFSKITHTGIVNRLKYIIDKENEQGNNYTYDEDSISYIAKLAEGGMRSAITLMEKTLGLNDRITMETVVASIGVLKHSTMFDLTDYLCKMNKKGVIQTVEDIHRSGYDLKLFVKNYTDFVLDLCKYDLFRDFENLFIPNTYEDRIKRYERQDFDFFLDLLNSLIQLGNNIKWDPTPKPLIESTLLLLCTEG
jgi:DNA polymerase-3 subunit gamma/tau